MANEWNKTAFVEFEAMMRRRLRSGAAPVAACAGFDLDVASAYLEDALGGSHRAGYESHLAGCAACRRHLIELARLARCAPQAEAQPVTVSDQSPAWVRWREVVAGWFDLSAWNLKWQIVGATGAAFAILIAVLGVQSWRQASDQAATAFKTSATPLILAEPGALPLQTLNPEASPQGAITPVSEDLAANNQGQSQIPAPTSLARPKVEELAAAVTVSDKAMTLAESHSGEAPNVAKPGGAEAGQNPPSQPRTFVELDGGLSNAGGSVLFRREDSKEQATKDTLHGLRIIPRQEYNPMNPGQPEPDLRHETLALVNPKPEPPLPSRPGKPQSGLDLRSLPEKVKRALFPIRQSSLTSASEKRAKPEKQDALEDQSPKPMLIPIRDKVFRFEKGMLIDREYNPEMQEWRVWTLTRGSELYKKVLASDPMLKEFFDRGPILIVWKNNRIYKVLK